MEYDRPPFFIIQHATEYTAVDVANDPLTSQSWYRDQRTARLNSFRLSSHDPRLWRVRIDDGASPAYDTTVVVCQRCGMWTGLTEPSVLPNPVFSASGKRFGGVIPTCDPLSAEEIQALAGRTSPAATDHHPPFFLNKGATNYRRVDLDSDGGAANATYLQRRNAIVAALRLASHDPRVWKVNVPAGEAGRRDIVLVRCESCGVWAPVTRRSARSGTVFDASGKKHKGDTPMCVPLGELEMRSIAYAKERNERLVVRAIAGVLFGLLALGFLVPTIQASNDKRISGLIGMLLWGAVSAGFWWSYFDIRSRR